MALDREQSAVVTDATPARQLVQAGPGCGKTHVACARVAHLLDGGEVPERILLLSFTRTAVHELRNRIADMATAGDGASLVRGVEIRTLDSLAWRLATGASELGSVDSYEETVFSARRALERARRGDEPEIAAYAGHFSHVFVDEAQDLVGPRALLVIELLNSLDSSAGWTVFVDPAQAIYGWSTDGASVDGGARFIDLLEKLAGSVKRRSLEKIHRTTRPRLLELLAATRAIALDGPGDRVQGMRSVLAGEAPEQVVSPADVPSLLRSLDGGGMDALLLFRRRADALLSLSYVRDAGLACRLRVGGLPRAMAPWIATIASHVASAGVPLGSVTRSDFARAWSDTCSQAWIARGWSEESAWDLLTRISGSRNLDLRRVADRLAAAVVPDETFNREIGPGGPVIGTVHGSKGREARHVIFCLAEDGEPADREAADEEARVMYVATSRARERLEIRRQRSTICGYHEDRAWHSTAKGLQVEIGRDGDLDPAWALEMGHGKHAMAMQGRLAAFDGKLHPVHVVTEPGGTWTRQLVLDDDSVIGALSRICNDELWRLVRDRARARVKSPPLIRHLTWVDVTTVALRRDHPRLERLAFPWRETRLLLAPVVAGMGFVWRYWS